MLAEENAGEGAGFSNKEYEKFGAKIVNKNKLYWMPKGSVSYINTTSFTIGGVKYENENNRFCNLQ